MKKRILSLLLAVLMIAGMIPIGAVIAFAEDDALHIGSADDWKNFADAVAGGDTFEGKTVVLENDISVSITAGQWNAYPFSGTFDGQGHTINYNNAVSGEYRGVFSYALGAVIRNLKVSGTVTGSLAPGGVAGCAKNSQIINCSNSATITSVGPGTVYYGGGIVGVSDGGNVISGCKNFGNASGRRAVGGIVGEAREGDRIENCINSGAISVSEYAAAGIVGSVRYSTTIVNCINTGDMSGSIYIGGITGDIFAGTNQPVLIENCLNYGNMTATSDNAAGISGRIVYSGTLINCFSSGVISKIGSSGALVGWGNYNFTCENCYYEILSANTNSGLAVLNLGGNMDHTPTATGVTDKADVDMLAAMNAKVVQNDGWYYWTVKDGRAWLVDCAEEAVLTPDAENIYHITSDDDWTKFSLMLKGGETFAGKTVVLENDISVSITAGQWNAYPFSGTFDGQGHTINYNNAVSGEYRGVFSYALGAVIRNLEVSGTVTGTLAPGGVAGCAKNSQIINCSNSATITSVGPGTVYYGGGIVGVSEGGNVISGCKNFGNASGRRAVGGIVGEAREGDRIENCINSGAISVSEYAAAGIVGSLKYNTTIVNCINTGAVSGSIYIGGITGDNSASADKTVLIANCINYGDITATSDNAAGISGRMVNCGTLINCFSSGVVSKIASSGLIAGWANNKFTCENCYYEILEGNGDLLVVNLGKQIAVKNPTATGVTDKADAGMLEVMNAKVVQNDGWYYWTVEDGRAWLAEELPAGTLITVPAKTADCGNAGWAQYYAKDGKLYEDEDCTKVIPVFMKWSGYIPATGVHNFVNGVCTQCGSPGIYRDNFLFNDSASLSGTNFNLTSSKVDRGTGWVAGGKNTLTLTPKTDGKLEIKSVEARLDWDNHLYGNVGVSSGTKRESGGVDRFSFVHVDNVNAESFTFGGGAGDVMIGEVNVYYSIHTHTPVKISERDVTPTEHGISTTHYYCTGCGHYFADADCQNLISDETAESYTIHNWSEEWLTGDHRGHYHTCTCAGCSATKIEAHTGWAQDGVCDVCGYSGVFSETILFNNSTAAESDYYKLTASTSHNSRNNAGWGGVITVSPKNAGKMIIRRIEAVVCNYGGWYDMIGVSNGRKRETGSVADQTIVHVDDVDAFFFSFTGGNDDVTFKDITVFFEFHEHSLTEFTAKDPTPTEHGISTTYYYCDVCKSYFADEEGTVLLTEAQVDGYTIHNWPDKWSTGDSFGHICTCTCTGCSATKTEAHTGYSEDGVCDVCGYSDLFAETFTFSDSLTAESEHFALSAFDSTKQGWLGGGGVRKTTIVRKNGAKFFIESVEAVVGFYGPFYSGVGVSKGKKVETGNVDNGSVVHVENVNEYSFSFAGGRDFAAFSSITVFLRFHEHDFTEIPPQQPTSQKHGSSDTYYYCDECGKYFADKEGTTELTDAEISAYYNVHHILTFSAKDATPTEHGISTTYYYCDVCAKYFADEEGKTELTEAQVLAYHNIHHILTFSAKDPTPTEHGISTTYYYCDVCGKYFADEQCEKEITQATVDGYAIHYWSAWSTGDPYGHTRTCTVCGKTETEAHTGYSDDGVCDVCGYSGLFAMTFPFSEKTRVENEYFALSAAYVGVTGWWGGDNAEPLTIEPKVPGKLLIKRIEAVVGDYGERYGSVGVSSGSKKENGSVNDGSVVHIENVNKFSFSFAGGSARMPFKDITVFVEFHEHTPTEILAQEPTAQKHGSSDTYYYCEGCGKYFADEQCEKELTQAAVDGYTIHYWPAWSTGDPYGHTRTCTVCGKTETEAHTGYSDDGVCDVCGYSGLFAMTFPFSEKTRVENEYFALSTAYVGVTGWWGGDNAEPLTIEPKVPGKLLIKRIEAVVGDYGERYGSVGVSSGSKKENGSVNDGSVVHIENVNEYSFSFAGGSVRMPFKDITVFVEFHEHAPIEIPPQEPTAQKHGSTVSYFYCDGCGKYFADEEGTTELSEAEIFTVHYLSVVPVKDATPTEHGISTAYYKCDVCGKCFSDEEGMYELTQKTLDSYTTHYWSAWSMGDCYGHIHTCTCPGCNAKETHEHTGYLDDGVCDVCGYSGLFAQTIKFNGQEIAESEHFSLNTTSVDPDRGWEGGFFDRININPRVDDIKLIKRIEAVIGYDGDVFGFIGVSSGQKREGNVENGTLVHVDNVDALTFSFSGGLPLYFKDITVIYEVSGSHEHHPVVSYDWNDDHTKCTATKHCEFCSMIYLTEESTDITVLGIEKAADHLHRDRITVSVAFETLGKANFVYDGDPGPYKKFLRVSSEGAGSVTAAFEETVAQDITAPAQFALTPGSTLTLTAVGEGFCFWRNNKNGAMISTDAVLTLPGTRDFDLTAVFTEPEEKELCTLYFKDSVSGRIVKTLEVAPGTVLTEDLFPSVTFYGCILTGWELGEEDAVGYVIGEEDTTLVLNTVYEYDAQTNVSVTVKNGGKEQSYTRAYAATLAVTAKGENFSYWTLDGKIISMSAHLRFSVPSADCVLEAVCGAEDAPEALAVTVDLSLKDNAIYFTVSRCVPADAKIVESGVLLTRKATAEDLTVDTAENTVTRGYSTAPDEDNIVGFVKDVTEKPGIWLVRGYVTYQLAGETKTVYTAIGSVVVE